MPDFRKEKSVCVTGGAGFLGARVVKHLESQGGEKIHVVRSEHHNLIEAGRARSHNRDAKRDRVRRKHIAEGSFADASIRHGFKRSRWRRLWRQRIQDLLIALIATCQNIRTFIASRSFDPRLAGIRQVIIVLKACFMRFSEEKT